ncbi:DUF6193 family natural product biosynthesis protein [Kitasatospora sp. NPDC096077]|uniref:DUF6193 family natural product biosynthesis protein n=1 Tax=Kitasatospora sp. NPDC096077 TaxID=3155544 RepID=UPI00333160D9
MDTSDETLDQQPALLPGPVVPDIAAVHGRGPADAVEARWQALRLRWQRSEAAHRIRSPRRPYPGVVPLLEAAAAQPGLRRLSPFTSHYTLRFGCSGTTDGFGTVLAGSIEPLHDGRFRVRHRSTVVGEVDTADEAVVLVLEHLPTGPDPVVTVTADEHL